MAQQEFPNSKSSKDVHDADGRGLPHFLATSSHFGWISLPSGRDVSHQNAMFACSLLFVWATSSIADGHSYLAQPASRNLLANLDGEETCPHCLQSGGPDNVQERGQGMWPTRLAPESHGLCGDPVQGKSNSSGYKGKLTHVCFCFRVP